MRLNSVIQTVLSMLLISVSTNIFALDPPTECPPLDMVQQSWMKLDDAFPMFGNFAVATSNPAINFSDRDWTIFIAPILADNDQEAVSKAQAVDQSVFLAEKVPRPFDDGYACNYTAKDHMTVMTITLNDGHKINGNFIISRNATLKHY